MLIYKVAYCEIKQSKQQTLNGIPGLLSPRSFPCHHSADLNSVKSEDCYFTKYLRACCVPA